MGAFLCPSLTSTRIPDPAPYLSICLKWMAGEPVVGDVLRQGYTLKGRVIRPAGVRVDRS